MNQTPINEAVELLPCPFCGGAMRVVSTRDWHMFNEGHNVDCILFEDFTPQVPADDASRNWLVAAWNRRAALAPPIVEPVHCECGKCEWRDFYTGATATHHICACCGFKIERATTSQPTIRKSQMVAPASAPSDGAADARDAARWRYVRDSETLESAVWEALEGTDCAPGGVFDKERYARGMDDAVDRAIASTHTTTGGEKP